MEDIIRELQDLRYLNWSRTRKSSGTAGSFLKSYEESGNRKIYYKLSDFDSVKGIVGHECINEIIVQRLLNILGIEHLNYILVHALVNVDGKDFETYLCKSEDFKKAGESKISFEDYYAMEKEGNESPMVFCKRKGWEKNVYEMLLTDYLVLNRDRHGANIEVLRNHRNVIAVISGHFGVNKEATLNGIVHISTAPAPNYRVIDILNIESGEPTIWAQVKKAE